MRCGKFFQNKFALSNPICITQRACDCNISSLVYLFFNAKKRSERTIYENEFKRINFICLSPFAFVFLCFCLDKMQLHVDLNSSPPLKRKFQIFLFFVGTNVIFKFLWNKDFFLLSKYLWILLKKKYQSLPYFTKTKGLYILISWS